MLGGVVAESCGAAGATDAPLADAELPACLALIAVTRSPLRILAVPVRPRLPAMPWSSASFMVLRLPARLGVSPTAVCALARSVVFVTKDPSPSYSAHAECRTGDVVSGHSLTCGKPREPT